MNKMLKIKSIPFKLISFFLFYILLFSLYEKALSFGEKTHSLFFHAGRSLYRDKASDWGSYKEKENVGQMVAGVTYRTSYNEKILDFNIRAEFISFSLEEDRRFVKLSFLPLFTFPSVDSLFPIYAGFGAGLGSFFKQTHGESYFSLDYQFVVGIRLFNILDTIGFFLETAMKNHIFLFNNGKHTGFYASLGVFFSL